MRPHHWAFRLLAAANSLLAEPAGPTSENLVEALRYHPHDSANSKLLVDRSSIGDACHYEPTSGFLNSATEKFAVNGTGIPEVDFDVGESYSGLLPISNKTDEKDNMFFWFFPTVNEQHKKDKEITIWLNGGPGCSSLAGLLIENGPFVWQPGTLQPKRNPWSWHLLTNVVWIDQPIGTGFSQGEPSITNEDELAAQFMGFWRNFVDLFGLHGWRVNIATESYGGFYGPYISSHFIDANDTDYFNLSGLIIYDGVMTDLNVDFNVLTLPYISRHKDNFALNDTAMALIQSISDECGFTEFYDSLCTPKHVFNTSDGYDGSSTMPSNQKQLPHVIDTIKNVIIAHGDLDWLIPTEGVLLGIQNMTWGGELGFQCKPQDPFYVPYYGFNPAAQTQEGYAADMWAGTGVLGTVHEERGLTFVVTKLAGHQGPGYAPAASFRHLEKLLGRVGSLSGTEPFTLPELKNIAQHEGPLGKGTVIIP
ncbi:hypothetical protein TrVFT333_011686 [Trichoderma virens FT-333]|nr:hypothetical protein TrVFT333_011686 [Trichoderma virens FT-333]